MRLDPWSVFPKKGPEMLDSYSFLWHKQSCGEARGSERSMTERVLRLVAGRREDRVSWDDDTTVALSPADGWNELRRELDRSRRFGHEFVLMRMDRIHSNGSGDVDLVQKLPNRLRSIDRVWGVRKQTFVLLPEAGRDVAVALIARLRRESPGLLPAVVRLAAFPADGLTGGALIELLNKPARGENAPGLDVAFHQGLTHA
jgi:hypothetical protein